MFDKKSCVKSIHLVTDEGLCNRKAFYKVKKNYYFFHSSSIRSINMNIKL